MQGIRKQSVADQSYDSKLLKLDIIRQAKQIIEHEANALNRLAASIPDGFYDAIGLILDRRGAVIVTGVGKAGWIGQKISASLASTGTISHFLNPSEAYHGDLGRIASDDVVLALSNSGETGELLQILPQLNQFGVPVIAITSNPKSTLANCCDVVLDYGKCDEACYMGLAPTTTTTAMLALGDALTLVLARTRGFEPENFARYHPGGSLGKQLSLVDDMMRPLAECRLALETETVRKIYVRHSGKDRRVGVILVTDKDGQLSGLFTDSDLARLLERQQDNFFDRPIGEIMTKAPITITSGMKTMMAVEILACRNLSELPVVDSNNRPIGLIDITDMVSLMPKNQVGSC